MLKIPLNQAWQVKMNLSKEMTGGPVLTNLKHAAKSYGKRRRIDTDNNEVPHQPNLSNNTFYPLSDLEQASPLGLAGR